MKPKRTEKITWSPNLAYAVGLITTDGSLSADGRHIDFTSKEKELIELFRQCLSLKNKIGCKFSGEPKKTYYRVQFGDVVLYRWLNEIGVTAQKSKTIKNIKIPDKYFFDFLRGSFDGDGCFYSFWDKRWQNSFMFYTVFNSGSKNHIEWMREKINTLIDIKGHICYIQQKKGIYWQLKYAKTESRKLLPKLYYSNNIPFLKSKYLKIKKAEVEELADSHP